MSTLPTNVTAADLQVLGLTERESKVYLALIARNGALPTEIPALCSVPRAKVYETLHRLLNSVWSMKCQPVPASVTRRFRPDHAVEHLLLNQQASMSARERLASNWRTT